MFPQGGILIYNCKNILGKGIDIVKQFQILSRMIEHRKAVRLISYLCLHWQRVYITRPYATTIDLHLQKVNYFQG
jgi:hypothetical protein